jgi:RecG-like helicase
MNSTILACPKESLLARRFTADLLCLPTCVQVYAAIHDELESGGRVYIVCPLVTESGAASMEGVKATEQETERLRLAGVFGNHKCASLHGKMSAEEKSKALKDFAR